VIPPAPDDYAEEVLGWVEQIPPGQVLTYGDLAALVGRGGPRQVGSVMASWGGGVPWWRVVRADGRPAAGYEREALDRLRAEGTPLRAGGDRVDLTHGRYRP
jgi:alkylated DNA nucleotide flippase Atl1